MKKRTQQSHRFYFAALHEAWSNLPERLAKRFTSPEQLRAFALIRAGFCETRSLVCSSPGEARRVATFMRPGESFGLITVEGSTVWAYTARSQSMQAMGKEQFERSKQAVLEYIAALIGVTPDELKKAEAA